MADLEGEHGSIRTDQIFLEMNNQNDKLSTVGRALAEQVNTNKRNSERKTHTVREENTPKAGDLKHVT